MPKLEFTQEEINNYANRSYKYTYKELCEEAAREICVHANGEKPEKLLYDRRPNESLEVFEYRKAIWEPITQEPIDKVIASLQKIRRSPDWVIKYPEDGEFNMILDGGELEQYCEYAFPYFKSVTNWTFGFYLRKYLLDANSVVFVRPAKEPDQYNYLRPVPEIFDCFHVIDMVEDDYAVLSNPNGAFYYDTVVGANGINPQPVQMQGDSFYVVTTQQILRYDQVNGKKDFQLTETLNHNLGILPAFKVPASVKDIYEGRTYQSSRIEGMVCHLNEAAREYSDLQAAKVNHMFPERWEFTQSECTNCKGTGRVRNPRWTGIGCGVEEFFVCDKCVNGYKVAGPYSKIVVRPINNVEGQTQIPTPPAGYIEKDVEIIKVQEASVDAHIKKALSAVNMEFLNEVPLTQSGIAKEVDRDESRNMIHSVAEDLVSAMDRLYWIIAKYRYGSLYPKDEDLAGMLPQIPVPERFDLITSAQAMTEIKMAKDAKANPLVVNAMEVDFADKRFSTDPEIRDQLLLELELDPMPNIAEDDKNSRLQNDGITKETYIISSNIHDFVARAQDENPDFIDWDSAKQREKMNEYATEMIKQKNEELKKMQVDLYNQEPIVNGQPKPQQQQDANGLPATNYNGNQ